MFIITIIQILLLLLNHIQADSSMTVIDILSENVEFSDFLSFLQKNGHIPMLNEATNITLLAPVNSAFINDIKLKSYLLRNSITSSEFDGVIIAESKKELPDGKFSPVLLNNTDDYFTINGMEVVDQDMIAYGQDSVVQGINELFSEPVGICDFIKSEENSNSNMTFDIFNTFFMDGHSKYCDTLNYATLLLPYDSVINFNQIEINYLISRFGVRDLEILFNNVLFQGYIGGDNLVGDHYNQNNKLIRFESKRKGNELLIDGKPSVFPNLVMDNGIIHIVDSFDISDVVFNLRKYLYGLGLDEFVSQLDFKKLDNLVDDKLLNQTLFIFKEEEDSFTYDNSKRNELVIESDKNYVESMANVNPMVSSYKNLLLYHFMEGNIGGSGLYDSKVCRYKLNDERECLKLKIKKDPNTGRISINDDEAHVINSENAITIGNTDVYLINEEYNLPITLKKAVISLNRCTKLMNYMEQFGLLDLKYNGFGYTIFMPCVGSWSKIGDLTVDYLQSNDTAMKYVIKSFIVNDLVYSDFKKEINTTDLNGNNVTLTYSSEDKKLVKLDVNIDNKKQLKPLKIFKNHDIIFNKGVVQPIKEIHIPQNIRISKLDLLNAANNTKFIELLKFANLSSVLYNDSFSVIVPSEESMTNISKELTTLPFLTSFLKLHILPSLDDIDDNDNDGTIDECSKMIPTFLESVHLTCSKRFNLQIHEGSDSSVRVLKTGCATNIDSRYRSCVYVIDSAISPDWLNAGKKLKFHLPLAALGVGFVAGIIFIFVFIPCSLLICVTIGKRVKKTSNEDDESQEHEPLIINEEGQSQQQQPGYSSINDHPQNFEASASSRPIQVGTSSSDNYNSNAVF